MTRGCKQQDGGASGGHEFPVGDELRGERATLGKSLLDVQRDLRIKAAHIAAIENADPGAFPNPSFIPGYVRSYARYLGRDPEEIYARFCAESGFAGPATAKPGKGGAPTRAQVAAAAVGPGAFRPNFPLAEKPRRGLPLPPLSALGSLLVLAGLVGGLGYGGWTVLQNIQRVHFAPVEDLPTALAAIERAPAPDAPGPEGEAAVAAAPDLGDLGRPVAAAALADLYRSQELEVPILVPRDGPIAAIDPDAVGLLADADRRGSDATVPVDPAAPGAAHAGLGTAPASAASDIAQVGAGDPQAEPPATEAGASGLMVVAERAAWIRVYLKDKTVLFERILETGETYSPPADVSEPLIWAGNSGSVYVRLDGVLRGPLGSGTRAVRDVPLEAKAIAERYGVVDPAPEAIGEAEAEAPEIEAAAVTDVTLR